MVFARIVYKNGNGWKTGKHVYYCAERLDSLVGYAKKCAKGREWAVHDDFVEGDPAFSFRAVNVLNVDSGLVVKKVLDGVVK